MWRCYSRQSWKKVLCLVLKKVERKIYIFYLEKGAFKLKITEHNMHHLLKFGTLVPCRDDDRNIILVNLCLNKFQSTNYY